MVNCDSPRKTCTENQTPKWEFDGPREFFRILSVLPPGGRERCERRGLRWLLGPWSMLPRTGVFPPGLNNCPESSHAGFRCANLYAAPRRDVSRRRRKPEVERLLRWGSGESKQRPAALRSDRVSREDGKCSPNRIPANRTKWLLVKGQSICYRNRGDGAKASPCDGERRGARAWECGKARLGTRVYSSEAFARLVPYRVVSQVDARCRVSGSLVFDDHVGRG
jgi:hypothetical protein